MQLVPAFGLCCDESDPKTTSPITEKVCKTGSPVVLVRSQLRVGKHIDRYEKEAVPEPLKRSGQSIMRVIGGKVEGAVVPHRRAHNAEADCEKYSSRHNLALDQLRGDRGEERDHKRARTQDE